MRASEDATAVIPGSEVVTEAPSQQPVARPAPGKRILRPFKRLRALLTPLLPNPQMVLALVLLAGLLARIGWLDRPNEALIFDEAYYINAARVLIDVPVPDDGHYAGSESGIDPNKEHPPLGKLMIAGSMKVFGDGPLGWRFPSIVAGMLSIVLLYGIVRAAGGDEWLGVLIAAILALENLSLVHSRIGTLDMTMTAFMLAGAWCYLKGWPLLAGLMIAVAAMIKLIGVYALGALLMVELFPVARMWLESGRFSLKSLVASLKLVASFIVVWIAGMWVLDVWVTNFDTPFAHLDFILDYGFALTREGGPANQESDPWQWLINEVPMTYLRVDEEVTLEGGNELKRAIIDFRGAMNPIVIGIAPLGLAFAAYRTWQANDRLALWAVAWFIATFVPFLLASLIAERITYIFYVVPIIPAFVVGTGLLLRRAGLPAIVLWGVLFAVLVAFIGYYPIRRF